jgi:hypothetical protein
MGLQTKVETGMPVAVEGMRCGLNLTAYTAVNLTADEDGVTVGLFAWRHPDDKAQNTATGAAEGTPLGVVERIIDFTNRDMTSEASMLIPKGRVVTIGVRGDYWVRTTTAASLGQVVFVNTDDGTVATDAPGATVTDHEESVWKVESIGAAGELIKISNWRA